MAGPSTQLAAECSTAAANITGEYRRCRIGERADRDGGDGETGHQPLRSRGVDQRAAGHLPDQRHEAPDRENEADIDLGPFLRGQVDRDEWTKAGLHVGDEEDEPVEPAQAAPRWTAEAVRSAPARLAGLRCVASVPRFRRGPPYGATAGIRADNGPRWLRGQRTAPAQSDLGKYDSEFEVPEAPSTTTGLSSLNSGAART